MAVQGPYTTESEEYYQGRPKDYVYGQVVNLIRKYTLDSGRSQKTFEYLLRGNQKEITDTANTIFESIKSNTKQALGKEPTAADILDVANDITQWGTPVRWDKSGRDVLDIENLKGSVLVNIPQILVNKENQINLIKDLESKYTAAGEAFPEELRRQIFRKPMTPEATDVFAGKLDKELRERRVTAEAAKIPAQEEQAINELERALSGQQQQYFTEQALPSITSQLNVRGLLDTGSLATALATEAGRGRARIEGVTTPMRAQSRIGGVQRGFEQTLRGALESGRSLEDAINFSRQLYAGGSYAQKQEALSGEAGRQRQYGQDIFGQNQALEMAKMPKGPSVLDYYLRYGLGPSINLIGAGIKGWLGTNSGDSGYGGGPEHTWGN